MEIKTNIDYENLARAILVLMGSMDEDDAIETLRAIGYTLLDAELFPDDDEFFDENELWKVVEELKPYILDESAF